MCKDNLRNFMEAEGDSAIQHEDLALKTAFLFFFHSK